MIKNKVQFTLFFAVLFGFFCTAQEKMELALEDIYKNGSYAQKGFGPVRWMKDNKGYSTLETNSEVGGSDIVTYDAKSGKRSVIVSASKLIPTDEKKPLKIADYQWSEDNSKLLIFRPL